MARTGPTSLAATRRSPALLAVAWHVGWLVVVMAAVGGLAAFGLPMAGPEVAALAIIMAAAVAGAAPPAGLTSSDALAAITALLKRRLQRATWWARAAAWNPNSRKKKSLSLRSDPSQPASPSAEGKEYSG